MRKAVCRSRPSSSSRRSAPGGATSSAVMTRSRSASCSATSSAETSIRSYRGRTISSTSATTSGSASSRASRNGRAAGEPATARRTVGRLLRAGPGRYTAGRPPASNGATWPPSSSRMTGLARAAGHNAECRYKNAYSRAIHSSGCACRNSTESRATTPSAVTSARPASSRRKRHSTGVPVSLMDSSANQAGAPVPYSVPSWAASSSPGQPVPPASPLPPASPVPPGQPELSRPRGNRRLRPG